MYNYSLIFILICIFRIVKSCQDAPLTNASATFYQNYDAGACSFKALNDFDGFSWDMLNDGIYIAALGSSWYSNSLECGSCFNILSPYTQKKVTILVTDLCPDSGFCQRAHHFDLSTSAFEILGTKSTGVLENLQFVKVPCPTKSGIKLKMKDGSNDNWTSFLVSNHKVGIKSVSIKLAQESNFKQLQRSEYNFFISPNDHSKGPFTVRVESVLNEYIDFENIPKVESNRIIKHTKQFSDGGCDAFASGGRCISCSSTSGNTNPPTTSPPATIKPTNPPTNPPNTNPPNTNPPNTNPPNTNPPNTNPPNTNPPNTNPPNSNPPNTNPPNTKFPDQGFSFEPYNTGESIEEIGFGLSKFNLNIIVIYIIAIINVFLII